MKGKRVQNFPENPCEYYGPIKGYTDDKLAVFFFKPNARDFNVSKRAKSVQFVISPPHIFIEEQDGTLTIKGSISDKTGSHSESDGWHGYLTKGEWIKI